MDTLEFTWEEVWIGLRTKEEILKDLKWELREEKLSQEEIVRIIDDLYEKKNNLLKDNYSDDFNRLANAFKNLNNKGILSEHNTGETLSDGHTVIAEVQTEIQYQSVMRKIPCPKFIGYCFYHYQDIEPLIPEFNSNNVPTSSLLLAFGPMTGNNDDSSFSKIGKMICEELKNQELKFEWNHPKSRIELISFKWTKETDLFSWDLGKTITDILGDKPSIKEKIITKEDKIRIISGPIKGFTTVITEIFNKERYLTVEVSMFGRVSEFKVSFDDIEVIQ